jgi:hypothetical protein
LVATQSQNAQPQLIALFLVLFLWQSVFTAYVIPPHLFLALVMMEHEMSKHFPEDKPGFNPPRQA